jgi:hypothetical protein
MATADADVPDASKDASPRWKFYRWYAERFQRRIPEVLRSDLVTSYFVAAFGELYEYCTEFLRITRLTIEAPYEKSTRTQARRMGWRWYSIAPEEGGDPAELAKLHERFNNLAKREALFAEQYVTLTTDRPCEGITISRSPEVVLPTYLFRAKWPNDGGEDYWTPSQVLDVMPLRTGEDEPFAVLIFLYENSRSRVRRQLERVETALKEPKLIVTDVDLRKLARNIDLQAVVAHPNSPRKTAEKEFLLYLRENYSCV